MQNIGDLAISFYIVSISFSVGLNYGRVGARIGRHYCHISHSFPGAKASYFYPDIFIADIERTVWWT